MNKYNIHNDFKKYETIKLPLSPLSLPLINVLMSSYFKRIKLAEGLTATTKNIPGYNDGIIAITIYEPEDIGQNAPCLIYLHGGAFALKAAPHHKTLISEYALRTPCKVVFVDYRLAPKHPFPTGVEDCYAAYEWVHKNAETLGIDKKRIAIGGDSAGGALAAGVSLMARDRNAPSLCFQMLIYPVTDARQITESIKNYIDTPIWNAKLNKKMWELYLKNEAYNNREYASPMEAPSLKNLPNTYIEVSEFDCLRDEGINFAEALQKNGVHVDLYKTVGTIHGFEVAEKSEIVHQSITRRIQFLQKAFIPNDINIINFPIDK